MLVIQCHSDLSGAPIQILRMIAPEPFISPSPPWHFRAHNSLASGSSVRKCAARHSRSDDNDKGIEEKQPPFHAFTPLCQQCGILTDGDLKVLFKLVGNDLLIIRIADHEIRRDTRCATVAIYMRSQHRIKLQQILGRFACFLGPFAWFAESPNQPAQALRSSPQSSLSKMITGSGSGVCMVAQPRGDRVGIAFDRKHKSPLSVAGARIRAAIPDQSFQIACALSAGAPPAADFTSYDYIFRPNDRPMPSSIFSKPVLYRYGANSGSPETGEDWVLPGQDPSTP